MTKKDWVWAYYGEVDGKHYFSRHGQPPADAPFHYRNCGRDDVYLINGVVPQQTSYGDGVAIELMDELQTLIDQLPPTAKMIREKITKDAEDSGWGY